MPRSVEVASGFKAVVLPDGKLYTEGEQAVLTDQEWGRVNPGAIGVVLIDLGAVVDPGVDASFATDADLAAHEGNQTAHGTFLTNAAMATHEADPDAHRIIKTAQASTGSVVGLGGQADVVVAFTEPFPDASYIAVASIISDEEGEALRVRRIRGLGPASVTVNVVNNAAGPRTGTVHVIAVG